MIQRQTTHLEQFRPQFHFTPPAAWMNDPNGLFWLDGLWHLYYQYYPDGVVWGPMHWGHAVSKDLVHWDYQPIALRPDEALGMAFSGSAVVDSNNSSGLCPGGCPVAVFTHAGGTDGQQKQSIAHSPDGGNSWVPHPGNPVIPNPGIPDFRDPKVFWHQPTARWIMVVAAGDQIRFYGSTNLMRWTHLSNFGPGHGASGKWECPDLFPLAVDGNVAHQRWVMMVSTMPAISEKGTGTQYFVGQFDGEQFVSDNSPDTVLWMDHGPDFYAPQTWSNVPSEDGRCIAIAWMSSWEYGAKTPTSGWRGAMTVPRTLGLAKLPNGTIRLVQAPVAELEDLRGEALPIQPAVISGEKLVSAIAGPQEVTATWQAGSARAFGFRLHVAPGQQTVVGYDSKRQVLFADRTASGQVDFSAGFAGRYEAPLALADGQPLRLRILVDKSSVEVLANDGQVSLTLRVFPDKPGHGLVAWAAGGEATVEAAVYPLRSVWVRGSSG